MFRRTFSKSFFTLALLLAATAAVVAQNAPVRGRVEMKGADGKPVGVPNLAIDCYRTDINGKFPASKTDKKGYFSFAGLPLGATFVLAISGPGISADIYPNVKAGGADDIVISVREGDGKAMTEAEVRERLKTARNVVSSTEPTAEQKKEQEEYEKKVAELSARNEKAKKSNELVNEALKAGSVAFEAKNWDLAIAKFEEGYQVSPDFAGSAPVMLNNKSLALISRASDTYNKAVVADQAAKMAARDVVKADLSNVIVDSELVNKLLQGATAPDPQTDKEYKDNLYKAMLYRKNAFRLLAQTSADMTRGKEALPAFQAYMAIETDPVKKARAQVDLAATLQDSQEYDAAVVEFQKVIDVDPTNADALAGMGLCMVTVGYVTMTGDPEKNLPADEAKGKAQLLEAANFLQRFLDTSPPTHKLYASVKESIDDLKKTQNVAPTKGGKTTTTTKKKP